MLPKPDTCSTCPLHTKGKGFVPDQLAKHADYRIYGEAPGSTEITDGKPFQGKAGFVLKNWIMRQVPQVQIAAEKGRVSYANILRCLPPEIKGRPYPTGAERAGAEACCTQYQTTGDEPVVILCGDVPQRYFFGPELDAEDATDHQLQHDVKGVMGRIGRVYERDSKRWVFAPHPAYVLRQPAMVEHAQRAFQIATNSETIREPRILKWEHALAELGAGQ